MREVSKVDMLEVKDEEDRDEKEIVAKHACGLSWRPVVSPPWEGSCVGRHQGHAHRIQGGSRLFGLSRGSPSQVKVKELLNQDFCCN